MQSGFARGQSQDLLGHAEAVVKLLHGHGFGRGIVGSPSRCSFVRGLHDNASPERYLYQTGGPDFRSAALALLSRLVVQYGLIIALALCLGFVRGRRRPSCYGVTLAGTTATRLIVIGILVGMLASLPEQIFRLVNAQEAVGSGTRFWALQSRVPWNFDFWLYMAVGSYLIVPVFEEFFTRGYLLGRYREAFSVGGSLVAMAVFFSFAHGQYLHANALMIEAEVTLIIGPS